jgi:heat shock protein 90kDa beta
MLAKKTLEINPHHPVMKELLNKVRAAGDSEVDEDSKQYAQLLFNIALLNSGFLIENPGEFTEPIQGLLKLGFGLRKDAPVEEIEIDISSVEDDEGSTEEPDVEGEVEVEEYDNDDNQRREYNDEL